MTNYAASDNPINVNAGMPGAAPLGAQMQGNPNGASSAIPQPALPYPQNPRDGVAGDQTQSASTFISRGLLPLNVQPTNVSANNGAQSLLALLATGQVVLGASAYGISSAGPAAPSIAGINGVGGSSNTNPQTLGN